MIDQQFPHHPPCDRPQMKSGLTTSQMLAAPQNAIYVWCNAYTHYARALASHLGRLDLQIRAPEFLRVEGWNGKASQRIVCDHAMKIGQF